MKQPLKHYTKIAPSLLSMYPQYNISRTPYTPNQHTLTTPLQQPNITPDLINNNNKPKPSPSNKVPLCHPTFCKKGTATGPLANYTDFLCNFALYKTKHGPRTIMPYLQTFSNIMQLLLDGTISPSIATTF
jgi:hypothetical protein